MTPDVVWTQVTVPHTNLIIGTGFDCDNSLVRTTTSILLHPLPRQHDTQHTFSILDAHHHRCCHDPSQISTIYLWHAKRRGLRVVETYRPRLTFYITRTSNFDSAQAGHADRVPCCDKRVRGVMCSGVPHVNGRRVQCWRCGQDKPQCSGQNCARTEVIEGEYAKLQVE